jgi:hypothetical protein
LRESPDFSLKDMQELADRDESQLPPLLLSLMPIVLPVILIAGFTVIETFKLIPSDNPLFGYAETLGNKNIALTIAAIIAMLMLVWKQRTSLKDLAKAMQASGKMLGHEFPTREAFVNLMAGMSDRAQSQYLEWLFDFFDDYKKGLYDEDEMFGWVQGRRLPFRSLDLMRAKADLYQVMQPQRNLWWARKIDELLKTPGTYFVAVGQLHVMGPDGIPRQLERLGITIEPLP